MRLTAFAPANWTIRVRLTVLYGALFFVAGAIMLALTYLLVRQSLDARGSGLSDPSVIDLLPDVIRSRFDPEILVKLRDGIVAERIEFRDQTLASVLTQGTIALGLVGIIAIGLGWLMAQRVLAPLHRITDTAARIAHATGSGGGLHERIALAGPRDEIAQLADTFDAMLERLDQAFDGQRRLIANASHELRTPLAINRALIEVAVTRPDAPIEVRQLGEALLANNSRHERLIEGLLLLADSEHAITEQAVVDLADVARHVTSEAGAAAAEAGVAVTTRLDPARLTGDPVLLERLVNNLVENAIRYNQAGGWVTVDTGQSDGGARLVVTNSGPIVQPYQVETIFQPFRRLPGAGRGTEQGGTERGGTERTDRGFGLGLSIVAAVARAHRGHVTAEARPEGGLVVTYRPARDSVATPFTNL